MHGKRGAVLVCVDNLPPGVSRKALKQFVQQAVDRGRSAWQADAGLALGIGVREYPAGTDAVAINRPPSDPIQHALQQPTGLPAHTTGAVRDLPQAALSVAALAKGLGAPIADQQADASTPCRAVEPRHSGPANATHTSQHFAQPPGEQRTRRTLRLTSNIADCAILRVTNQGTGEESYRGLVSIRPARCALTVIALLDGLEVAGFRLRARRFQHHGESRASAASAHDEAQDGANLTQLTRPSPCALELLAATPAAARPQGLETYPERNPAATSGEAPARSGALASPIAATSTAPAPVGLAADFAPGPAAASIPARPAKPAPPKPATSKPATSKPGPAKADPLPADLAAAADGRAFAH